MWFIQLKKLCIFQCRNSHPCGANYPVSVSVDATEQKCQLIGFRCCRYCTGRRVNMGTAISIRAITCHLARESSIGIGLFLFPTRAGTKTRTTKIVDDLFQQIVCQCSQWWGGAFKFSINCYVNVLSIAGVHM